MQKEPPVYVPVQIGKTRLEDPRPVVIVLDEETYFWIKACRKNYVLSPAYEPYQVGEVIRRLLSLLADAPMPLPGAPGRRLSRGEAYGLRLNFQCDAANYARLTAYHAAVGGVLSGVVRDCIQYAAQYAMTLPGEEAKRLLWPGYAELPPLQDNDSV